MKVCKGCGAAKPLSDFSKAKKPRGERPSRGGMGVAARCKDCVAEARSPGIVAARLERAALVERDLKRCGKCRVVRPLSEFHANYTQKDGRASLCPICIAAYKRGWNERNPDAFSRWHEANRDHRSRYFREWREQNLHRRAAYMSEWSVANRDRINAKNARRVAAKLNASVSWADQDAIRAMYAEAARLTTETGVRHEVDHIYPLQGEAVCGLHCEANLQILTKTENIRKLNRMPDLALERRHG